MTLQLLVRPEAGQDIEEAANWYERQRPGLGHEFLDEVIRAFGKIAAQPASYPILHRDTHRALTSRFPYGVFYRVQGDKIIIIAVLHGARNPRRWEQRA